MEKVYKQNQILLYDGSVVRVTSRHRPYLEDVKNDKIIAGAVIKAIQSHFTKGNPIARYDLKKKVAYLKYPDGRIEYGK